MRLLRALGVGLVIGLLGIAEVVLFMLVFIGPWFIPDIMGWR